MSRTAQAECLLLSQCHVPVQAANSVPSLFFSVLMLDGGKRVWKREEPELGGKEVKDGRELELAGLGNARMGANGRRTDNLTGMQPAAEGGEADAEAEPEALNIEGVQLSRPKLGQNRGTGGGRTGLGGQNSLQRLQKTCFEPPGALRSGMGVPLREWEPLVCSQRALCLARRRGGFGWRVGRGVPSQANGKPQDNPHLLAAARRRLAACLLSNNRA